MNKNKKTPDYILEKIALGEMQQGQLSNDDLLRLEQIKKSNEEILSKYPPELMAKKIMNKYLEEKDTGTMVFIKNLFRLTQVKYSLAAVFTLLIIVFSYQLSTKDDYSTNRTKGTVAHLEIYKKTEKGPEKLPNLSKVSNGDILQLSVLYSNNMYIAIVSVDGRNKVTFHVPEKPEDKPLFVKQTGENIMPTSYELDDAPLFEKFIFLSSSKEFNVRQVVEKFIQSNSVNNNEINIETITLKK